uniref:Uncharacterized protein n=1 Tax=Anguilla anguilla TaxID=7936 RepID=A0A0E9PMP2_ANGAN
MLKNSVVLERDYRVYHITLLPKKKYISLHFDSPAIEYSGPTLHFFKL